MKREKNPPSVSHDDPAPDVDVIDRPVFQNVNLRRIMHHRSRPQQGPQQELRQEDCVGLLILNVDAALRFAEVDSE